MGRTSAVGANLHDGSATVNAKLSNMSLDTLIPARYVHTMVNDIVHFTRKEIIAAKAKAGITDRQAAEHFHCHHSTVSGWLRSSNFGRVGVSKVLALMNLYGLDPVVALTNALKEARASAGELEADS